MGYCNDCEQNLVGVLKHRKTALSGPELAAMLGTTDRQVRALINHRLKALGNAVVPAQAYPIFEAIMEVENPLTGGGGAGPTSSTGPAQYFEEEG